MMYAYGAEVQARAEERLESELEEIHFLLAEQENLRETADLILQKVFPGGPKAEGSSAWPERLKLVPDRLLLKVKDATTTATIQALAMMKSHYPFADLKRFEAGYAVDIDEAKLDALTLEVELIAEMLVELLDLDDL